jgi:hypothetical protein
VPESAPESTPVPNHFLDDWLAFLSCAELRVGLAFFRHGFAEPPGIPLRNRHQLAKWLGISTDMLQRTLKTMLRLGMIAQEVRDDEVYYYLDLSWVPRGEPF